MSELLTTTPNPSLPDKEAIEQTILETAQEVLQTLSPFDNYYYHFDLITSSTEYRAKFVSTIANTQQALQSMKAGKRVLQKFETARESAIDLVKSIESSLKQADTSRKLEFVCLHAGFVGQGLRKLLHRDLEGFFTASAILSRGATAITPEQQSDLDALIVFDHIPQPADGSEALEEEHSIQQAISQGAMDHMYTNELDLLSSPLDPSYMSLMYLVDENNTVTAALQDTIDTLRPWIKYRKQSLSSLTEDKISCYLKPSMFFEGHEYMLEDPLDDFDILETYIKYSRKHTVHQDKQLYCIMRGIQRLSLLPQSEHRFIGAVEAVAKAHSAEDIQTLPLSTCAELIKSLYEQGV
jgi:hypothetical protein